MIRATHRLDAFERQYALRQASARDFHDALAVYRALWREAAALNDGFPGPWQADIEADVELARVLNGLSERP